MRVKGLFWTVILLSLIPGGLLAWERVRTENGSETVTLLMDEPAIAEQAAYEGVEPFALATRYREAGLNGVALYEQTLQTLAEKGKVALLPGTDARAEASLNGRRLQLPPNSLLVRALTPGALAGALSKNRPRPQTVRLGDQTWYVFSEPNAEDRAGAQRPAGPDQVQLRRYRGAGWDIAYRPVNYPNLADVGTDFPDVSYLIHEGLEVAGNPERLSETVAASQDYLTGLVEGTEQAGMSAVSGKVPLARVFSVSQEWLNTLTPQEVADKYLLAANERGARLLYLRPYTDETVGNMRENTEALVRTLRTSLEAEGYRIGPVRALSYTSPPLLRALAGVGVLAGVGLLATLYPGVWGALVALGVLALGVLAGGFGWDALALTAALSFPVLGYALLPAKLWSVVGAVLISLAGAVLLAAVGSDRNTLLAVTPFSGVAATLVVPPALFLFYVTLRERTPAAWVHEFWSQPLRLGDVALTLISLAALAFVLLRRGNFPIIGASEAELGLRALLSDYFARPRFKELLGHPLAVLALLNPRWPTPVRGLLLTAGVVALSSVVNSFSHYHTPLLVSLERTAVALALGLVLGLLLNLIVRPLVQAISRWLSSSP
ncbi:MAG: Permease of the drug/metabolite transporter (DMT) superfamily [uncultured Truepera sp.]|uniref:Permease of the drug/metabolite transporter (DMT) superfamily n=1 Tax=uncultured Truepera sp. TaxID=543023 RepID=A0A6J4V2P4_9DEIN|nr:MAG: Permease of the drug/metabolite transporter (DMT) superfamily [uncultured Truepera sp.]